MEPANQSHPGHDEDPAHDQRPQNPPQQNFVLILGGHAKIAENQKKNEEIVHAERKFKNVTGDELQSCGVPLPEIDDHREGGRERDPESAPPERFAGFHHVGGATQNPKVEGQHRQHENIEEDPESEIVQAKVLRPLFQCLLFQCPGRNDS